jgi:hypothetical protein
MLAELQARIIDLLDLFTDTDDFNANVARLRVTYAPRPRGRKRRKAARRDDQENENDGTSWARPEEHGDAHADHGEFEFCRPLHYMIVTMFRKCRPLSGGRQAPLVKYNVKKFMKDLDIAGAAVKMIATDVREAAGMPTTTGAPVIFRCNTLPPLYHYLPLVCSVIMIHIITRLHKVPL